MKIKLPALIISFIFILSIAVSLLPQRSNAAEDGMSFSVSAIQPANQLDKRQSYFDLRMKQGAKQEIEVRVSNTSNQEVTVEADVNAAITNSNGVVDYSWNLTLAKELAKQNNKDKTKEKIDIKTIGYDKTLKYPMPEITTSDRAIKLPANSEGTYKITLKMPDQSFDGIILGGLRFKEQENSDEAKKAEKGVQIENKFAYVIGLMLSETDTKVTPDLKLDKSKIKATSLNGRNAVTVNLQNPEMVMLRNFSVDAKVYQKKSDKPIYQAKKESLKMAPNSNFNYAIDWQNQPLKAGTYKLKLHAENKAVEEETSEMNHSWDFDEEFTITADEARKINDQALELEKQPTQWWVYVIIGLLLLILLVLIVYLVKRYLNQKKEKEQRRKARLAKKRKNAKAQVNNAKSTKAGLAKKKEPRVK